MFPVALRGLRSSVTHAVAGADAVGFTHRHFRPPANDGLWFQIGTSCGTLRAALTQLRRVVFIATMRGAGGRLSRLCPLSQFCITLR